MPGEENSNAVPEGANADATPGAQSTLPAKPADVPWGDWIGPRKLSHRHKFIAHLAALGLNNNDIAERTGMTPSRISIVLGNTLMGQEIERCRKEIFAGDLDQSLRLMLPKAVKIIDDVLSPTAQVKKDLQIRTAFKLMERTHGMPKQSVAHSGSLLRDLFDELDSQEGDDEDASIPVDGRPVYPEAEVTQETKRSPIDAFVEENFKI